MYAFLFCGVKLRGLFLYIICWFQPHGYHNDSCRFGDITRNMQQLTNAKIVSQYLAQGLNYANESYLENLKPLTIEINYVAHYCGRHLVFFYINLFAFYVHPTQRMGEYIVFGADLVVVGVGISVGFFVSMHYLLN